MRSSSDDVESRAWGGSGTHEIASIRAGDATGGEWTGMVVFPYYSGGR